MDELIGTTLQKSGPILIDTTLGTQHHDSIFSESQNFALRALVVDLLEPIDEGEDSELNADINVPAIMHDPLEISQ
jgi:hypothetical protein